MEKGECQVEVADNRLVQAEGVGIISLNLTVFGVVIPATVRKVLRVPSLGTTLISHAQLGKVGIHVDHVKNYGFYLREFGPDGRVVGLAPEVDHLYPLLLANPNLSTSTVQKPYFPTTYLVSVWTSFLLWHQRLAHLGPAATKGLTKWCSGMPTHLTGDCDCVDCLNGKQTRKPFTPLPLTSRSTRPLELVHSDLSGRIPTSSLAGSRSYIIFIDDFTRFTMIYFLKRKSEAFTASQDYEAAVVKHWTVRAADPADSTPSNLPLFISKLRTDGGGDYTSLEFTQYLRRQGIEAQVTTPYTPQSNGVSERANRTIMERVRSMMSWSGLPDLFWAEAVATATYLKNRTPTRGLEDLKRSFHTPFEGWFGKVPDLGHLWVWGCVAMVHVPAEKTKKLAGRSEKCVFMGYCLTEKQFKVYNPQAKRMFSTRDVIFREGEKWGNFGLAMEGDGGTGSRPSAFSHEFEPFTEKKKDVVEEEEIISSPGPVIVDPHLQSYRRLQDSDQEEDPNLVIAVPLEDAPLTPPQKHSKSSAAIGVKEMQPLEKSDGYQVPDIGQTRQTRSCQSGQARGFFTQVVFEPKTYQQALQSAEREEWLASMQKEISAMNANCLGRIVEIPPERKAIGSKWVYRVKTTSAGELDKLKSRLVALGNRQVYGIDYHDTYAPVERHETVNLVLTIIAGFDFEAECLDVCSAFLGSTLEEGYEVYLRMPQGVDFDVTKGEVILERVKELVEKNRQSWAVHLKKSIYGLKQSPWQWYKTVTNYLSGLGFVSTSFDPGLLYYRSGSLLMVIVLFVDDLLLASSSSKLLRQVKSRFCGHFKVTESGDLSSYIALKIKQHRGMRTITISQRSYLESILE